MKQAQGINAIRRRLARGYGACPRRMSDAFKSARADVRELVAEVKRLERRLIAMQVARYFEQRRAA